ncbi:MAG: hypothetical protein D6744_01610, partial [Planctomycetota bacterium]
MEAVGSRRRCAWSFAVARTSEASPPAARRQTSAGVVNAKLIVRLGDFYRRVLHVFWGIVGPNAAYRMMGALARRFYRSYEPVRLRSEAQCRAALGDRPDVAEIAERAFVHRCWNLVDLALADRFLRASTISRYGGRIPSPLLELLLDAQRRGRPVILVTAYYGPFDLLPVFLGYNGVRAGVVYRPHANAAFDAYRKAVRGRSGCEMISTADVLIRVPAILEQGGTVAILSDHHAGPRGVLTTFLGLPTRVSRSVALLADRYGAFVGVAGIHRVGGRFRFELLAEDYFGPDAWRDEPDPITYITRRTIAALERLVLSDPSQ